MPSKRSSRNTQRFYCPYCERRLWRSSNPTKYNLFYVGASEILQNVDMPRQSAIELAKKGVYVDNNVWLEEFFCGEHGSIWMKLGKKPDGKCNTSLATRQDWQKSTHTINPETPNPSVGQFTYRMSRQASTKLTYSRE